MELVWSILYGDMQLNRSVILDFSFFGFGVYVKLLLQKNKRKLVILNQ